LIMLKKLSKPQPSPFAKKTIRDASLTGKTVLLRADYNVPVDADGNVQNDYRISQSLPTIQYLLKQKCKIIICSHLGRPKGKDSALSLKNVAKRLHDLLKKDVQFVDDCVGPKVVTAAKNLKVGDILLLENLRFYEQEKNNDKDFAKQLADLADVFVQDGFGVVHRADASTDAITKMLPSVAGLLLEKEVLAITGAMQNPKRPLMTIVGGAKISDKIEILKVFINRADIVVIGGAMANTFLLADGIAIGESVAEPEDLDLARDILRLAKKEAKKRSFVLYLPQDAVVADEITKTAQTRIVDWDAHVIAAVENYPKQPPSISARVRSHEKILDIGPFSGAFIAGAMQMCNTVIWNGTMGVAEAKGVQGPVGPFAHGTELIIESMMGEFGRRPNSLIGGGDTAAYVAQRGLTDCFDHVSTGGGAGLELMAGHKLPGIEALQNK